MRLWGISPTNSIFYSPEPRAEVYYLRLHINISKLGYYFRTVHQYNKTETILDNENQMHRDVTIYSLFYNFQFFFDT